MLISKWHSIAPARKASLQIVISDIFVLKQVAQKRNWINCKISQNKGFVFHRDQTFQLRDQRGTLRRETRFQRMSPEPCTLGLGDSFILTSRPGSSRMPGRLPLTVILQHWGVSPGGSLVFSVCRKW